VAGFVAPRHLQAIKETQNVVLAATDPNDSVGIFDRYAYDIRFFREIERFDRFLEKLRRGPEGTCALCLDLLAELSARRACEARTARRRGRGL